MNINKVGVAVAVATTDTVLDINVEGMTNLGLEVKNSGGFVLDAFSLYGVFGQAGNEVLLASLAGDYSTPLLPLKRVGGTPVSLAAGGTAFMILDVSTLSILRIKASSATSPTTLDFHGTAN